MTLQKETLKLIQDLYSKELCENLHLIHKVSTHSDYDPFNPISNDTPYAELDYVIPYFGDLNKIPNNEMIIRKILAQELNVLGYESKILYLYRDQLSWNALKWFFDSRIINVETNVQSNFREIESDIAWNLNSEEMKLVNHDPILEGSLYLVREDIKSGRNPITYYIN